MANDPKPQSGEVREQDFPKYPDGVAGERQVIRNFEIESEDNRTVQDR